MNIEFKFQESDDEYEIRLAIVMLGAMLAAHRKDGKRERAERVHARMAEKADDIVSAEHGGRETEGTEHR